MCGFVRFHSGPVQSGARTRTYESMEKSGRADGWLGTDRGADRA